MKRKRKKREIAKEMIDGSPREIANRSLIKGRVN